jgi:hypothetical protein
LFLGSITILFKNKDLIIREKLFSPITKQVLSSDDFPSEKLYWEEQFKKHNIEKGIQYLYEEISFTIVRNFYLLFLIFDFITIIGYKTTTLLIPIKFIKIIFSS